MLSFFRSLSFAQWLVIISLVMTYTLVAGVLFGPWEIDPNAAVLIALVAQPGGVALGWLLPRTPSPADKPADKPADNSTSIG